PAALQKSPIGFLVETDEKSIADPRRWRTQVAGGAEQVGQKSIVIRPVFFEVKLRNLLAAVRHETLDAGEQSQSLARAHAVLVGIDLFGLLDVLRLKEPLSFLARGSRAEVVNPINLAEHEMILRISSVRLAATRSGALRCASRLDGVNTSASSCQSSSPIPK